MRFAQKQCSTSLAMRLFLLIATLLAGTAALAGGKLPCRDARVFPKANLNALILPYRYSDERTGPTEQTVGARLASLIQQETLFSMLKYASVGATELVSHDGTLCDVNEVIRRVTRDINTGSVLPGKGLAVLWGRIYQDGSNIYVQSYIRFLVRGADSVFNITLRTNGEPITFEVAIPSQGVALAPRRVESRDFEQIESRAAETLVLRVEPDERAKTRPYSQYPHEPLTYSVVDQKGDWMRIQSQLTGREGWVRARNEDESWGLRQFLPELAYLDGVLAYLRIRIDPIPERNSSDYAEAQEAVAKLFAWYEQDVGVDAARDAVGLSRAILGQMRWIQSRNGRESADAQMAAKLFQEARSIIPDSSEARNLAAITSPWLKNDGMLTRESIAEINDGLLGAIAVDGQNQLALRNLEKLYRYLKTQTALSPYDGVVLDERLSIVKQALAARKQ